MHDTLISISQIIQRRGYGPLKTTPNKIGIALIGCGYSGCELHAVWYQHIPELQLIAAVDQDIERARKAADRFGAKIYSDNYRDVLKNSEIDVVDINVPAHLNREITVAAAEAGKHILCEKPMAVNLDDADAMIAATEKNRIKFMVGHVLHFFPEYISLKKAVKQNVIGKIYSGNAIRWIGEPYYPLSSLWNKWYGSPEMGGGVTLSTQVHDIDILKSIFGNVKEVYSVQRNYTHKEFMIDDFSTTLLFFDDERMAATMTSWASSSPLTQELDLFGDEGYLSLRSGGTLTSIKSPKGLSPVKAYLKDGSVINLEVENVSGYFNEIKHFISCIINDEKPIVDPYSSRESLKITIAALNSAKIGKKIKID